MSGFFITGTDTGVGKTFVATVLIRSLVRKGWHVAAMKPVAAGAETTIAGLRNDDAVLLARAANVVAPYQTINPYCFAAPVSPHIAAKEAGIVIDIAAIRREFDALVNGADCVIVEGAGGWLAPIGPTETMADIAIALRLPVILVVGLRLGCLNHALLTAQAVRASGLRLAHWVGNEIDPGFARRAENIATLSAQLGAPLAVLPCGAVPASDSLAIDVSL